MIFVQILYINLSYEIHSLIDSFLYFFLKRMLCTRICLFANEHLPFVNILKMFYVTCINKFKDVF